MNMAIKKRRRSDRVLKKVSVALRMAEAVA